MSGGANYNRHSLYYYGYDHDTVKLNKNDIHQIFNDLSMNIGLDNFHSNQLGINYHPRLTLTDFFDNFNRKESTFYLSVPLEKKITKGISIIATFIGDYSTFSNTGGQNQINNVSSIHPAVDIDQPKFILHAGINPTWSNGKFYLLPDIVNETNLMGHRLILSSGWISYIQKNSFQYLVQQNPFLSDYPGFRNTRIEEKYSGIKGSLGKHFNYNTKFSLLTYSDLPLFVNDSLLGNKFNVLYEDQLSAYQLHAEVGYIEEENFQVRFTMDWFNFFKEKTALKPWGMVPFQADLSGAYFLLKNLKLTADVFALSGSYFPSSNGTPLKTKGAFDVNAGITYQINDYVNLWLNFNNLLDSKYQRWHNYPTLGRSFLGGILVKF
ncbi:MAG: hypothetical protein ACYCOO_07965 [Chitinophagaceae bacterium]